MKTGGFQSAGKFFELLAFFFLRPCASDACAGQIHSCVQPVKPCP